MFKFFRNIVIIFWAIMMEFVIFGNLIDITEQINSSYDIFLQLVALQVMGLIIIVLLIIENISLLRKNK